MSVDNRLTEDRNVFRSKQNVGHISAKKLSAHLVRYLSGQIDEGATGKSVKYGPIYRFHFLHSLNN